MSPALLCYYTGIGALSRKSLNIRASSRNGLASTIEQPTRSTPVPLKPPPNPTKKFIITKEDQDKEAARRFRRNVFSPDDWVRHRSSSRYWRHVKDMATSANVASLLRPTLAVGG